MSVSYVSRSVQSLVSTTHSRSSSPYDWSTRAELYPEAETAKGQPGCTHTEIAHTHSETEIKHNSQPETTKGSWTLLLPRRRHRRRRRCCCCLLLCCCLIHDPRCIAEHNPSQQTVSHFVFFGTHAEASNGTAAAAAAAVAAAAAAAAQQQQVQQQGRPKHMYEYTIRYQAG